AVWCAADDAALVSALTAEQAAGNQADNGWKPVVWTAAAVALCGSELQSGSALKMDASCNTHWTKLKGDYNHMKTLHSLSGWGWDDTLKQVVASDDQWTTYITGHGWAKAFHSKGFPLVDEIASLVDGRVATGAGIFR
ncbi:hypothetical protein BJV74DRAFT_728984, partial [Russula compacta]